MRAECRSAVVCEAGQWTEQATACSQSTVCNQLTSPPDGQPCSVDGTFCTFGDTLCGCSQCLQGSCMAPPTTRHCAPPPTTPGCPPLLPNDGTPCTIDPSVMCTYGYPCGGSGITVECPYGLWYWNYDFVCSD